jgi:hypothetical protein
MDQYTQLHDALASYRPSPTDLLRYLRFERDYHGDDFCLDDGHRSYHEDEFWGTFPSEVPRDDDGCILVEQAFKWATQYMDDFYVEGELAPFVRTMRRTEAFKTELMSVVENFTRD